MPKLHVTANRLLGVGLAAGLAAVTVALAVTGRLALYINPASAWFAVGMAVVALVGTALSFTLPLGAEEDHGHDHGHDLNDDPHATGDADARRRVARAALGRTATVTGGVLATGVVAAIVLLPPASLSAQIAMARDTGAPPLFQGADAVALATTGDTASFGVGEWAAVFATATNPDVFDGDPVTLTGFVTPASGAGGFDLTRLVITHCVIDAQTANLAVAAADVPETGQWVTVTGTVRASADGTLTVQAADVTAIDEPADPYEY